MRRIKILYVFVLMFFVCFVFAVPSQSQTVETYCSTDVPIDIGQDPIIITSDLTVPDGGEITEVKVQLQINHTWIGDLVISLESPEMTEPRLISRVGGNGDNIGPLDGLCTSNPAIGFILDDNGSDGSVNGYGGDIPGAYIPSPSLLDVFDGQNQTGLWTLTVDDTAFGDGGALNCWCLEITREDSPILQAQVPTLSEWGLISMAGILGIVGFMVMRRRKVTT